MRSALSISLPEAMAKEMDNLARETQRPRSEIVKEALRVYLWEERFSKARNSLRKKAVSAGVVTDEDVFNTVS